MKIFSAHGISDFNMCCRYKGYVVKEYFANYFLHISDVTYHMDGDRMEVHQHFAEPWRVTLLDTGESTMTGGRLKRVARLLVGEDAFCFTYGDGVSDVDITKLIAPFHRQRLRHYLGFELLLKVYFLQALSSSSSFMLIIMDTSMPPYLARYS
jgi:glucose-1-phosphate cytidylyltransferase